MPNVEPLEGRALLSMAGLGLSYPAPTPTGPPVMSGPHGRPAHRASGIVTKAPHFYEFYTGPKLAELNAVKASAQLRRNGDLVFSGTNAGPIRQTPAVYVWGVDRNGNLPAGPFNGRPNIRFDAVVVVSLSSGNAPSAVVVDMAAGKVTPLSASAVKVHGKMVSVTVPGNLLPSTGLAPSQYHFNYWPEDGGPPSSPSVASFLPEFTTAQVGMAR